MIYLVVFVLVLVGFILAFVFTGLPLPEKTEAVIDDFIGKDLQEFIKGETGFAKNGDVSIWYENIVETENPKGTILLVMGHSTTALGWSRYFFQPMLDRGYRVIRYDNRGVGMSDWLENWDKNHPYSIEDMALDGMAVLDAAGVDQAHVVGVSLGGMIAQRMAISHKDRVQSLTSLMSSGFMDDPELPRVPKVFEISLLRLSLRYKISRSERNDVRFRISVAKMLKSPDHSEVDLPLRTEKALYEIRKRKGYSPYVMNQHTKAVQVSGSRYEGLKALDLPVLVVHGRKDPLVLFEHGEKCASMIPGAKTIWIDDMGHEIPPHYTPLVLEGIFEVMEL
ncbi:MAG: alpha/beta hydrolase [Bacteroidota bacterium]